MTKIPTNFIEDQLIGDFLKANAGRFYGGAVQEDLPDEHWSVSSVTQTETGYRVIVKTLEENPVVKIYSVPLLSIIAFIYSKLKS
jgi:hypothetical protein